MSFLLISHQSEFVENNNLEKISRISSVYAYFFKMHLEKKGYKIYCKDIEKLDNNFPIVEHCFVTVNRGVDIIDRRGYYDILRSRVKRKICTICGSSKIVGKEDILFFFDGKNKEKCVKLNWMAEPSILKPQKDLDKLTILVDHKYYGDKDSRIYKEDKTEMVIQSLLNLKNKPRKITAGTPYYRKPIEIRHISMEGVNVIESMEDIKEFKYQKAIGYKTMVEEYNKADIFINTHYECMGLTVLECAVAGALIITFDNFMNEHYLKYIIHHKVIDNKIDWHTIIKKLDRRFFSRVAGRCNYEKNINRILEFVNKDEIYHNPVFQPKVAICFSGAIRNFERTYPSMKKYFLNSFNNPDIFMHCWTFNENQNLEYDFKWVKDNSNIDAMLEKLQPKDYIIDEFNNQWEDYIKKESFVDFNSLHKDDKLKNYGFNCVSMYYKIMKCHELMKEFTIENNVHYDLVIRARIDFIWEDYLNVEEFLPFNKNKLYLIKDKYATHSKKVNNDKFFMGSMEIMDKMSSIFNNIYILQKNYMLDGQVINEAFINENKIPYGWVGHKNTYYKCLGRHKIVVNKKNVFIECDDNDFLNELTFQLMTSGYNVNADNLKEYNLFFQHYKVIDKYDFTIKIIDNIITINDVKLDFSINLLNEILEMFNNYLIDFILSLLNNFNINTQKEFIFNSIQKIETPEKDEKITYKFWDKGYYQCSYIEKINKNFHSILYSNQQKHIQRIEFKINNLLKYYKHSYLPVNY